MNYPSLNEQKENISKKIDLLFRIDDFELSIDYLKAIHKFLFREVLPNSGKFRKDNLTKKEYILNGDTVIYPDYHTIDIYLKFDMNDEKKVNYSKLTLEEKIVKIADFTSRIWLVHPFDEGNTRTTCVFIEKYLKHLGFQIDNKIFKDNAEYFRNALVKSNYYNYEYSIHSDINPLINFFKKALIDPTIELDEKNLYISELFDKNYPKRKSRIFKELLK